MSSPQPAIGFIGLGLMGGPMARNLIRAGYNLSVYDLDQEKIAACPGAQAMQDGVQSVANADIVMTSVPSFEVAETLATELLPHARPGQIFIELSTMTPSQAVNVAATYAQRDIVRLDVPVSGGPRGAEAAQLRMFVGGDEDTARQCWPIFEVLGDPERIVYCGPAGHGQAVKLVNQLTMGLSNAIYLETIGYAVQKGIDIDVLVKGIGGDGAWRQQFNQIAQRIQAGRAIDTDVKFVQLEQFTDDARHDGYTMPLARSLYEFCVGGEYITTEEIYPAPSFWHELHARHVPDVNDNTDQ